MELLDSLYRNLQEEGGTIFVAFCLVEARKYLDSGIELYPLDLNLLDGDRFSFCGYLSANVAIPIVLLTVCDGAEDKESESW